jgi:hypothetical protein
VTEPSRLFDETDDELERLLIGSARSERSSARTRARTLTALGITGSAALAATAVSATAAPVGALGKVTWAKLVLGLSALGTIAAVPPTYHAWQRHQAAAHTQTLAAAPQSPTPRPTPTPTESTTSPDEMPAVSARASADLRRELGALDAARGSLAHGQPARALARLDAYAAAFPQPHLGLEAEILRIDALARSGRAGEARAHAKSFLRGHPHSVLAARARRYLRD